jgi:hypothetical protein
MAEIIFPDFGGFARGDFCRFQKTRPLVVFVPLKMAFQDFSKLHVRSGGGMNDKSPADLILRVGQFEAVNGLAAERQFAERFWRIFVRIIHAFMPRELIYFVLPSTIASVGRSGEIFLSRAAAVCTT